ncbi:ASPIC/UnbV domain-containing protein [Spirosoma sp. KNUC1025]|uniref:ASPIC/UnbV domain-containing protein n=1 Tax=Spirosoma sp. KNUC1025 TaxID=2894082 RepID=UPI00386CBD4A|nr:ASPIC/UnbV domain-containing protein [Spirosoma sp. KNUC1025]
MFVTNGYARDYTNMEFLKFTMDEQLKSRSTGAAPDPMAVIAKMPSINEPNYIFRNTGHLTFDNKTKAWGFDEPTQSNGALYADLDNDGDLDLVINNVNAEAGVYENHSDKNEQNHYLTVQLKSPNPAQQLGARVSIWSGGHMQVQDFMPVRGFQSSMYGPLLFGLGSATQVDSVRVRWVDGKTQLVRPGRNNDPAHRLIISYAPTTEFGSETNAKPFWQGVNGPGIVHREDTVNDFKIQPLLPYMLSQTGPRFAVGDINGDKLDDVYVGGGRGQGGRCLFNVMVIF